MPFLIVEERGQRRHVPIRGSRASLGRAPDNDVVLADDKSSRHHAVIELTSDGGYLLRDLDSLNGCYFDGLRVREHSIGLGDTFVIGEARITLETEESTAFDTQMGPAPRPAKGATQTKDETRVSARSAAKTDTRRIAEGAPSISHSALTDALGTFERAASNLTPERLFDTVCEFTGRILPHTRVCLAVNEDDAPRPRAFFNFITGKPREELPQDFNHNAARVQKLGEPNFLPPSSIPARAYVPLSAANGERGVLYCERENTRDDFSDSERDLLEGLAAPAAAALAIQAALRSKDGLVSRIGELESALERSREELQNRFDQLTADLSHAREETGKLKIVPEFRFDYSGIIGHSAPMVDLFKLMDKVTDLPVPVLIIGESGTGKELIARALHFNSLREKKGRFVAENCAALPETLLESELFGYQKGAFTGADRDKVGLFEMASGGTIFLDEIGETTPALQAKLLRVLEEGEIRPVGSNKVKKVDFRLIAATNRPLEEMVKNGRFRQDLFYRINVITVKVPPLRDRKDDIPLLVDYFLTIASQERGAVKIRATSGVLRAFVEYNWPGNVRELENEVKRMVALSDGEKITTDQLSPSLRKASVEAIDAPEDLPLKDLVERVEKSRIEEVLRRTGGNKSKAAEALGLSRLGLRKKIERYGIQAAGGDDDGDDDE